MESGRSEAKGSWGRSEAEGSWQELETGAVQGRGRVGDGPRPRGGWQELETGAVRGGVEDGPRPRGGYPRPRRDGRSWRRGPYKAKRSRGWSEAEGRLSEAEESSARREELAVVERCAWLHVEEESLGSKNTRMAMWNICMAKVKRPRGSSGATGSDRGGALELPEVAEGELGSSLRRPRGTSGASGGGRGEAREQLEAAEGELGSFRRWPRGSSGATWCRSDFREDGAGRPARFYRWVSDSAGAGLESTVVARPCRLISSKSHHHRPSRSARRT